MKALLAEAARFRLLATDLAVKNLFQPHPDTARLAREHFIRAECYTDAAKKVRAK